MSDCIHAETCKGYTERRNCQPAYDYAQYEFVMWDGIGCNSSVLGTPQQMQYYSHRGSWDIWLQYPHGLEKVLTTREHIKPMPEPKPEPTISAEAAEAIKISIINSYPASVQWLPNPQIFQIIDSFVESESEGE